MSDTPQIVTAANIRELYAAGARTFQRADLSEADLSEANLSEANLSGANLSGADLRGADLSGADLRDANLSRASLRGANLRGANLHDASLSWANLRGAENIDTAAAARLMRCPPEGAFIAYKQCLGGAIVKLMIPAEARRSSATGYKCRAEFVDVLEGEGVSIRDSKTTYAPGQRVTCHEWDADRWNECGSGIHFYMSREEAEAHS